MKGRRAHRRACREQNTRKPLVKLGRAEHSRLTQFAVYIKGRRVGAAEKVQFNHNTIDTEGVEVDEEET